MPAMTIVRSNKDCRIIYQCPLTTAYVREQNPSARLRARMIEIRPLRSRIRVIGLVVGNVGVKGWNERATLHSGSNVRAVTLLVVATPEEERGKDDIACTQNTDDRNQRDFDGLHLGRGGRRAGGRVSYRAKNAAALVRALVRVGGGCRRTPCACGHDDGGERIARDAGNLLLGGLLTRVNSATRKAFCRAERDVVRDLGNRSEFVCPSSVAHCEGTHDGSKARYLLYTDLTERCSHDGRGQTEH